jgi:hypothetical protein
MSSLTKALVSLFPNAQFAMENEDITKITWFANQPDPLPTLEALQAEAARLEQLEIANQYQRQRRIEYPSIGDQLDALFHAGVFPEEMAAQIQAIKDKYPKPE